MRHLSFITTSSIFKFLECVPTRRRTTTTFKLIDRDARGEKSTLNNNLYSAFLDRVVDSPFQVLTLSLTPMNTPDLTRT